MSRHSARNKKAPGQETSPNLTVRKVNNPGITAALQNELSKRLEQVAFTNGEAEVNWVKRKVDTVNNHKD